MKVLAWLVSLIQSCAQWMPTQWVSSTFTSHPPWKSSLDREVFNTWNPLWYCIRLLYFYGPETYGGWGGLPFSTICTRLQGMHDSFWRRNAHECIAILEKQVQQIQVVIVGTLGILFTVLVLRYLLFYMLFYVSSATTAYSEFPGMTNVAQYKSQWERMRQDAFQYVFEWLIVPSVLSMQQQQQQQQPEHRHSYGYAQGQWQGRRHGYGQIQQDPLFSPNRMAPPMTSGETPWRPQPTSSVPIQETSSSTFAREQPLQRISSLGPQTVHFVNHYSSPTSTPMHDTAT